MSGSLPYPLGSSPGWLDGYVPSAAEWNAWWRQKLDVGDPLVLGGPYLSLAGGTMTGRLTLAATVVPGPNDAVSKAYVDGSTPSGGPYLALAGGTLIGPLTLPGPPVAPLQAATKSYVDSNVIAGGPFLPLAGGIVTGALSLSHVPANPTDAATKAYVDSSIPAGGPFLPLSGGTVNGPSTFQSTLRIMGNVGFYGTAVIAKPTITGSRAGNTALTSLISALQSFGLIADLTTA